MTPFKKYLMESVRTYKYHVRILGAPDKKWLDLFCYNLDIKFDAVDISEPKTTVIQRNPAGFGNESNKPVTIIKMEVRYPVIDPMVKQLAKQLNYDENKVRLVQSDYDESREEEEQKYENQMSHTPVLTHTELEDNGKEASKAYANQYLDSIREQHGKPSHEMSYAAQKTKDAFDPFKAIPRKALDTNSPLSHVERFPKPKTGSGR